MKILNTKLPEVKIIIPKIFNDERGYFFESYQENKFKEIGIPFSFPQDNQVFSRKSVIRGLHYQLIKPQGKLVRAIHGEILDVAVDIRKGSPNFGDYISVRLSEKNKKMLYVPEGFAHGYSVLSEECVVSYKCTNIYDLNYEYGIVWNDPNIDISWGIENPIISSKDLQLPNLNKQNKLPKF